jgi:sterol desaturase/sphingolipid hydroxylase (fatty acid hydroxylase superfamily)
MWIPLIVFSFAAWMMYYEAKHQGRAWPQVRGWWLRAILLNGCQVGTVYLAGVTWDRWLIAHQGWALHSLGEAAGALIGYLAITFFFYWWHRFRHMSDFLWRWFHQIHHSPKRLEIITAFYKHPFELCADSILCSLILYPLLGLNPVAASYAVLLSALAELFYHWNVSTPYWVGFIFQRPESHCIHHQDGVHAYNYADLPLWDMLFGTFRNPKTWNGKCGLGEAGEHRLDEMLLGVDVYKMKKGSIKERLLFLCPSIFLIGIGCMQMIGDLTEIKAAKALGLAFHASPAPKVFCTADSLETFSSQFLIQWKTTTGEHQSLFLTPEIASHIKGPYNRRNVYGAIFSYGPVLEASPIMKPLYEAVLAYSLSGEAPLLSEIGIDPQQIEKELVISVIPREGRCLDHLNLKKEVRIQ